MRWLRGWVIRLGSVLDRDSRDRELADELEGHVQMHIADNLLRGMSPQEARREALMKLGGVTQTAERYRERRGIPIVETLLQDLRFAARMLRKNPGFTAVAVLVMALGIGANTAMFSVVNAVLLKPLAFNDPDSIVTLSSLWKKSGHHGQVSAPDYRDWRDQSSAFESMAYYENYDSAVTAGSAAEYTHIAMVSPNMFHVFRLQPAFGREFSAEESRAGAAGAVILSSTYAVNHFGSAAGALGHSVRLLSKTLDIVGVMPAGFHFPEKTDVWFPANTVMGDTESRSAHNYRVVARLKPEVSLEQAEAQMTAIGTRLAEKYPDSNTRKNVAVTRMRDEMVSDFRLTLWIMLAAVGVVLLIACANLANMLLAKSVARTKEIAIRAALGAGRGRIVRQLITESFVVALLAGAVGVLLALWGSRLLVALAPGDVPRLSDAGIDARVLAFAFGVSVLASLLFGLAPALQTLRVDLNKSLKQGTTRASRGGLADRMRGAVVVPGAFVTLGIPLLQGRDFNDSDTYDAPFSAVINEKLARDAFPGQDPIGHMIYCGLDSLNPMRIVGVIGDVRQFGPAQTPWAEIYMPYEQHPQPAADMNVVVRTAIEPEALTETLRSKAHELSADVPVKFTTMEASLSENVAAPRFRTLLLGIFAGLAVCLAMAGVYGVMSYVVGQRSNELGLRMALGASPGDVLRLVLRQALILAGTGIVIGLVGALVVTRLLGSMLFGVKATDPATYAGVVALLGIVALGASYIPARRAARVDPIVALRYE